MAAEGELNMGHKRSEGGGLRSHGRWTNRRGRLIFGG